MNAENDTGTLGPAMRGLTEKQRAFVWAYGMTPGITALKAAEAAGFGGTQGGNPAKRRNVCKQIGYVLLQDERITAAIKEVAGKKILASALSAADFLSGVFMDPKAPLALRVRSAESLLDRGGLVGQQNINVNHHHTDETGKAMVERIRALAVRLGMDEGKLLGGNVNATKVAEPVMIDVTPEVKDGE